MAEQLRAQRQIPPKLEAVLVRLCARAPKKLSITQAVKMPYLVDVLASHVLGRPVSEGRHETWQHGVVTSQAWHYLQALPPGASLDVTSVPFSEEYRVEAVGEPSTDALSDEERRIVDFVAEEYAFIAATELGEMTKRMNPAVRSWGRNRPADLGGDAYERMTPEYLEMSEAVTNVSIDQLQQHSTPISDPEDVIA